MSEEELEAEIDEYVAEHGCKRIEAEAYIRFYKSRAEQKARRQAFIYQMQERRLSQGGE